MIKKLISVIGATALTLVAYPLFTDATGRRKPARVQRRHSRKLFAEARPRMR